MKPDAVKITNDEGESIHFFDNTYGDMGVLIKGSRGGERGDFLLSKADVALLMRFFHIWLEGDDSQTKEETPCARS